MTVFIDPPTWPGHGRLWSHLVSDRSYAELHDFAARLGIPARAFERDHYDVIAERYAAALAAGAEPVDSREIVRRLHAAGLRRRKRSRLADPLPAVEDGPRRKDHDLTSCAHLDAAPLTPLPDDFEPVCADCMAIGGRWVHLRRCLECNQISCCDSSPGKHATAHARNTGHPVVTSAEPNEKWRWCYVDKVGA